MQVQKTKLTQDLGHKLSRSFVQEDKRDQSQIRQRIGTTPVKAQILQSQTPLLTQRVEGKPSQKLPLIKKSQKSVKKLMFGQNKQSKQKHQDFSQIHQLSELSNYPILVSKISTNKVLHENVSQFQRYQNLSNSPYDTSMKPQTHNLSLLQTTSKKALKSIDIRDHTPQKALFHNHRRLVPQSESQYFQDSSHLLKLNAGSINQCQLTNLTLQSVPTYSFIIVGNNNSNSIRKILSIRNQQWHETHPKNTIYHFKWGSSCESINFDYLSGHGQTKLVNHFEGHECLTHKDNLFINLKSYCEKQRLNVFDFVPRTFVVKYDGEKYQGLEQFMKYFKKQKSTQVNVIWFVKPAQYERRRGIFLCNTFEKVTYALNKLRYGIELQSSFPLVITSKKDDMKLSNFTQLQQVPDIVRSDRFVIQQMIQNPLLINNSVYDLRVWVMTDHQPKCYICKEGYFRLNQKDFQQSRCFPENENKETNNASYLSFKDAENLLQKQGLILNIQKIIQTKVIPIIIKTFQSVQSLINPNKRRYCMQIFTYDFVLDQSLNPQLIDVNAKPIPCSNLKGLNLRMLDDALKLTLDVLFPISKLPTKIEEVQQISIQEGSLQVSIQIESEPGLGSQKAKKLEKYYQAPSIRVEQYSSSEDETTQNLEISDPKQKESNSFPVEGYRDDENLWQLIHQVKV